VPILVGSTAASVEKRYGKLLAPYLADPASIFIVSSDFCHWGTRFGYTYYLTSGPRSGVNLRLSDQDQGPRNMPIHESIRQVDLQCMDAVETGKHDAFLEVLEETGNTVCGRHPIGVVMAAVEELGHLGRGKGIFNFVKYDRSDLVQTVSDSSVSYCSAFALF
jgi:hypothetical protein